MENSKDWEKMWCSNIHVYKYDFEKKKTALGLGR